MRDLAPRHADQLLLRVAEDLAKAPVDADEAAIQPDLRESGSGQLEGAPVTLLAAAQRGLGIALRRDVGERRDDAVPVARVRLAQKRGVDEQPGVHAFG